MEVWKDIEGCEGKYQVSNYGRVKRLQRIDKNNHIWKEKILKPVKRGNYLSVHISIDRKDDFFSIHRLVAQAFCEKKEGCDIVNHIDNNPHNNNANNLEWTTYKGNMQHATKQGRMHYQPDNLRKAQISRKKPVIAIDKYGNEFYFDSQTEAVKKLGLNNSARGHIASACKTEGGYKTVGGYQWRYANGQTYE